MVKDRAESGKPLSGNEYAGVDRPRGGGVLGHGEGQLAVTGGHGRALSQTRGDAASHQEEAFCILGTD